MDAPEQQAEAIAERFRQMGLPVETVPGDRVATVLLPVGDEPFPGLDETRSFKQVRLAALESGEIKCLEPHCLFFLPLLDASDCAEPGEIEARIRRAWGEHLTGVARARDQLRRLDLEPQSEAGDAVIAFDLGVEDSEARARTTDLRRIVLPGRGALSGLALAGPEERIFACGSGDSGLDLQMAVTTHLERLARQANRLAADRRAETAREEGTPPRRVNRREHRVLLVGPLLASHTKLAESLRMRGYRVVAASSPHEAIDAFASQSFELMLVDAYVGRTEGLELVPMIQGVAGIEQLPVVIVDERSRPAVRERARKIGAVGYLTQPIDVARIAPGLARLLQAPLYRRYSRYSRRLGVACGSASVAGFTTAIGRLGMFVCTSLVSRLHTVDDFEIQLPEFSETLRVEAETVYRRAGSGALPPGIGLRFHSFPDGNEARLIEFLHSLDPAERRPA